MISRQWRGLARPSRAGDYVEHLRTEIFPQLRKLAGFVDASVLRRQADQGVEFLVVTRWTSLPAIREFAGKDAEAAVVAPQVPAMMIEYDRTVRHYEILELK
jgi:heme-degrading monooxygenase HmoA